jgi:putative endonuclease
VGFANIIRRLFLKQRDDLSDAQLGASGEKIAARYLGQSGYRILERNWKSPLGEIDIIGLDGETLVIVEVKTSRRLSNYPPEIRVNFNKQRKLQKLARYYMKRHHSSCPVRFDIISVWWEDEKSKIRHIENAF